MTPRLPNGRLGAKSDALVIGGGIAGCAVALHLARKGRKVTVLERDLAGTRASGVNFGGVRQNGRDLRELPLSMRARGMWDNLSQLIGFDGEFRATGNLRIALDDDRAKDIDRFYTEASAHGLGLVRLDRAELKARFPWLSGAMINGVLCPSDGHANPRLVSPAFAFAAQEAGATLIEHVEVTDGWYANGEFQVRASDGRTFGAPVLVNCAGAWGGKIAGWFGEKVEVAPEIPQMQVTEPLPYRIEPVLGVVGGDFYLRQTFRGNILFGSGHGRATADILRSRPLPETAQAGAAIALRLIPDLANIPVIRSWTWVDGDTADGVCVLGQSETHPGLYHAFGFSGHGFQLGPAVGAVLSELILEGKTQTEIGGLGIGRLRPTRKIPAALSRPEHPGKKFKADSEKAGAESTVQGLIREDKDEKAGGDHDPSADDPHP